MPTLARYCLLLLCLYSPVAPAAEPRQNPSPEDSARTLTVGNQDIVLLLSKQGALTPEARVARALERGKNLSGEDLQQAVQAAPLQANGVKALQFSLNGKPLFVLYEQDLDPGDFLSLEQAGQRVRQRLDQVRLQALELRSPGHMLRAAALALLATLALGGLLWLISRLRRASLRKLAASSGGGSRYNLLLLLRRAEQRLVDLTAVLSALMACYVYLSFVLKQFPYTRSWGQQLGRSLMRLLADIASSTLAAVPGLVTVVVIFLLTRLLNKGLAALFALVERGQLELPGLHSETVGATRRLASGVLWLFALTVAYPYLPGANSDAFKGVSVFFGLMVTLGSAGIMTHAMSGLVLIYSRAFRPGDYVQIGDVEGKITELSALSTKIQTRAEYEITLPNAVVVSGKVVNLSRHSRRKGLAVCTKVTIGYDTPWRQVQALLELAARRAESVDPAVAPQVRQLSLQDYYVEYELQAQLRPGVLPAEGRHALHAQIQDVFNEFGVQIMSPNFVAQPEQPVVVPAAAWYAPPAAPPDTAP
ncbi:mechanosensitive ion channel protein MscS [Chromobacterium sp. LK11]|uniref:mechanosensitive ion channel family protein n=1 Tax=Chromobacterium sp. LK11 TaxID=1628212 RepID=UPI000652EFFD|nr:mechanosensitive ion channel domain-containing protein [Chromobacterium sp. LK11]KMN82400.1 mechanosensitive ion channel protein MscS [Chromobacterium sp. LK11]